MNSEDFIAGIAHEALQGEHRGQGTLLPERLNNYVSGTNPVRVVFRR